MAFLYQVLIIILIGLHFNVEETKAESGCRKYCHKDCEQYSPGPEFSTCVLANVDCSCGHRRPRSTESIILPVSGVAICFIVLGCVLIFCSIMKMCNSSPTFPGPIQPNVGVGRDFSQPVTAHYPNASAAVSVVPVTTPPYNSGFTNSNFIGSNEGPPSYSEVVRENSDTNELNNPGWNFERK